MQENDFEKKLQQKMELLQVQPGAEVWYKIQTQVAQKKKKRRFAFFFLLAFIMGVGIAVTFKLVNLPLTGASNDTSKIDAGKAGATKGANNINESKSGDRSDNSEMGLKQNVAGQNKFAPIVLSNNETEKPAPSANNTTAVVNSAAVETKKINKKTNAKLGITAIAPPVEDGAPLPISKEEEGKENNATVAAADFIPPLTNAFSNDAITHGEKQNNPIADSKELAKEPTTQPKQPETQTAVAKTGRKKEGNRKWGMALSVEGGVSYVANSSIEKNSTQDYNGGGIGTTNGNPSPGRINTFQPPFQPGAAFGMQVLVFRKLSSNVQINMGLQYNYNSLSLKTGSRLDTTAALLEIYKSGSSNTHTNRYHYLTIPVTVSTKIFRIGNREAVLEAGVSVSKLLGAKALSYNSIQDRYYGGINELNTTLFSLSASAAINLSGSKKAAFYIGPAVSYSLTPLAAAGLHRQKRTTFIGIRMQKNIWK